VSTLLSTIAPLVSALTNNLVTLDANATARLAKLEGAALRFETIAPDDCITLTVRAGQLEVDHRPVSPPAVIVRGRSGALVESFLRGDLAASALEITGDETLLAELVDVLRGLRPDVEAPLSRFIGQESARNVVGFLEYGMETLGRIARDLGEESQRLARREAHRYYIDRTDLDHLDERRHAATLRVDRLEARIARLAPPSGS